MKILVVDDDPSLRLLMEEDLGAAGYEVLTAADGLEGLEITRRDRPDLLVVDIRMPKLDGFELCQRVREFSQVPVLILTAHATQEEDVVHGLDLGADDYLIKPFKLDELRARVRALLRRATGGGADRTAYIDNYLIVDLEQRRVLVEGQEISLTPTEFRLLEVFVRHVGQVLTNEQLVKLVWGWEYIDEVHYPRIYVSHLRRKLEPDPASPTYIVNEYGIGYRFVGQG
jgi:DNA-binding response OmpR family regulator